jgi:general secretion pathway protein M
MKQWFSKLSQREQLMVLAAVVVTSLLLLYSITWAPLKRAIDGYEADNADARETLDWMQQAVVDIHGANTGGRAVDQTLSISALVDTTLPNYSLVMQRYQPTGDDSAQLWLEDAPVSQVIAWLAAIERDYGMRLITVAITSADKQGFVKTRVRMGQP